MKSYRLNRLFNARSNRCFDVAVDHGFFNEYGFLSGIEDLPAAVATLAEAGPDAIQLTIGQARLLQSIKGRGKPSLVLRTDVANVYGKELPRALFSRLIEDPVVQALRLDATCVVVNLFSIPNEPEVTDQCIQNILRLKPECDHYGMPLMIEPLVFRPNAAAGGYMVDGDPCKILPLVRQAVELLADISSRPTPPMIRASTTKLSRLRAAFPCSSEAEEKRRITKFSNERNPYPARGGRHCVWPQRHPAPEPGGDDPGPDGDCA